MIGGWRNPSRDAEEQVRGLFADDQALDRGARWARDVLELAGMDPQAQPVRCIRELRRADRRISLIAGRFLVDRVAQGD